MKKYLLSILTCVLVALPVLAQRPTGYVNDGAGILSSQTKQSLEEQLKTYEASSTNEIVVATIPSLEGDVIENKAVSLFKDWGIGKKGKDNGILLLIALQEKEMRIEVGYGLEGLMTDATSGIIIRNTLVPAFKEGKYDEGVTQAIQQIISVLGGEPLEQNELPLWVVFIIILFIVAIIFLSMMAHLRGGMGGVGGGFSGGGFGGGFGGGSGGFGGFGGGGSGGGGSSGKW